jgi:mono/diheme cytochrome c family protein
VKILSKLLAVLVVLAVAGVAVVYSGIIDVAATNPEPALVKALLEQTREHSIERRAKLIQPPPLGDPAQVSAGMEEYQEMCSVCHGGPGVEVSHIAHGLNPPPPQFTRSMHDEPSEIFWIVKNGIKMTGMPAFGPTHDDPTLWSIVAFLKNIDKLTPEQKAALSKGAGEEHEEHEEHEHGQAAKP